MALKVEGVVDRSMHAEEALGRSSRFESLHLALSSPSAVRIGARATLTLHWIYRWYTLRGEKRPVVPLSLAVSVRLRISTSYPGLSPIDARRGGALVNYCRLGWRLSW